MTEKAPAKKAAAATKKAAPKAQRGRRRASGQTPADEEAKKVAEKADEPIEEEVLPEEREKRFRTPGFSRMKVRWDDDDWVVVHQAQSAVDGRILHNFADAYEVMNEVYDIVRTPEVDDNGEPKRDQYGFVVWKQTVGGGFEEDYTRLSVKQRENLMFTITTRLFSWEQRAADAWGEAMFAKARWEERFSIGYDAPFSGTIEDRTAKGNIESTEERYFAIFLTLYSRKADALMRTMNLLGQRLKDSMTGYQT